MERINQILKHPLFQQEYKKILDYEKDWIYCGHDMAHFIDVARIGYLLILEQGLTISKSTIYAAAFVHDIGRACQYESGKGHQIASGEMAEKILRDCGYSEEERKDIILAVTSHRTSPQEDDSLATVLYQADKLSRACYRCSVEKRCDWPKERKNMQIKY